MSDPVKIEITWEKILRHREDCVIFSDIQFRKNVDKSYITESGETSWTILQAGTLLDIAQYCKDNNIKVIFHTGDLFEEKTRISQDLYNYVWQLLYNLSKDFKLVFNTGNHDMFTFSKKSSLKPFTPFMKIISEPQDIEIEDTIFRIIPYGCVEGNLELSNNPENKHLCLMTHEDIDGLIYGAHDYQSSTRIKQSLFKKWKYVFNGHIHKPQEVKNIVNIGSPIQQSFNEEGEQKSFIHYKNGEYKRIPLNTIAFKTLESIEDAKNIDMFNYYRIKVSQEEVSDPIFKKYNVSPYITKTKEREIRLKVDSSDEEEIETYVDITKTNLNKEKLVKIGKELMNGED